MPNYDVIKNDSEWETYHNRAGKSVLFSNLAYYQEDERETFEKLAQDVPNGFELVVMSDHLGDTDEHSFRCIVYINNNTKEVLFATSGTRFLADERGKDDLADDMKLFKEERPDKMKPAETLNQMILDSLGKEAADYKFHYTGHSLGAAMAEMQAADMDIRLRQKGLRNQNDKEQISTVTFENPGTKPILEEMYRSAGYSKDCMKKLDLITFNNRDNLINTLNPQAGEVFTILPENQKERVATPAELFFAYLSEKFGDVSKNLSKFFKALSLGVDAQAIEEHGIHNFNEIFVENKGSFTRTPISMRDAIENNSPSVESSTSFVERLENKGSEKGKGGRSS